MSIADRPTLKTPAPSKGGLSFFAKLAKESKKPRFKTARHLVQDGVFPGLSEAKILDHARKNGIGRKAGRQVLFNEEDIPRLFEAFPKCHSTSAAVPKAQTGLCAALSGAKALKKAQALLTKPAPKK